jgi:hypothetical protein
VPAVLPGQTDYQLVAEWVAPLKVMDDYRIAFLGVQASAIAFEPQLTPANIQQSFSIVSVQLDFGHPLTVVGAMSVIDQRARARRAALQEELRSKYPALFRKVAPPAERFDRSAIVLGRDQKGAPVMLPERPRLEHAHVIGRK